ncbi:MAG: Mut7-C RNAse domain-containing protein [Thermoplasmata archaeon]|nr:Mut7-C RNAse domain-containing protein [Thermoplasmata archaeon]
MAESHPLLGVEAAPSPPLEEAWLVDEMLGKLARYLRILGCDAEYVQGLSDGEILRRLADSQRTLVTRDALLAERASRATLLRSVTIRDQLQELWVKHPRLSRTPRFTRCTRCNGELEPELPGGPLVTGTPEGSRFSEGLGIRFACRRCGQRYWRGSHTEHLERDLASWSGSSP